MTTHSNYPLQNFSTNNAKVLTENSQPVLDFKFVLAEKSLFSLLGVFTEGLKYTIIHNIWQRFKSNLNLLNLKQL